VVSLYKREFNQAWAKHPQKAPAIDVVLTENPMRPNGEILKRFAPLGTIPILDISFYGATPTQTAASARGKSPRMTFPSNTTYFPTFQPIRRSPCPTSTPSWAS
jgi:hypothetical protein